MPTYLAPGVYLEEVVSGARPIESAGTAVAGFVGSAEQGPLHTPVAVANWTEFTQTFGGFRPDAFLAHAVYGFFLNGGGHCYVVRVGGSAEDGPADRPAAVIGDYQVRALAGLARGPAGDDITVEVTPLAKLDEYRLVVRLDGTQVEEFRGTTRRGPDNIAQAVRTQSRFVVLETLNDGRHLAAGTVALARPAGTALVGVEDYVGDAADRTGLAGLEGVEEITMVAIPDLMGAYLRGSVDLEGVQAVQLALITHCELRGDCLAILDPPPGLSARQVREWRVDLAGYDSKFAALYYPWLRVFDPATGTGRFVPPSGHLAGIWARNDATRGVHKAPANEVVRGAVDLENQPTTRERELLNPAGINCLAAFPGRGIRVWGARTLSSDPGWRYLNVRRLFNHLEKSILAGTQWVVFEPNNEALWARVRRTVAAFLTEEWRKGALFGLTPDEAFYVRCDRETNPAESVDAGQVTCEIGVAPVTPAEFVIFRLAQVAAGAGLVEE